MPKVVTYEIQMSEDEFEIVKQMALRWKLELDDAYNNIEEIFPLQMQDAIREDMKETMETSERICEALGCQTSSLEL